MIIDIVLCVIFISAIIYGLNKGFLKVVARLLSTIISFVLAYMFAEPVGNYIATKSFISESIISVIDGFLNGSSVQSPTFLPKVREIISTGSIITDTTFSTKIADYIYLGLGFAIVFILVRIVLWVTVMMLDNILELPIINTFNKVAGCIAAAVLVYLEANVILAIIQLLGTFTFMEGINQLVNSSVIANFICDHNIVMNLIIKKIL